MLKEETHIGTVDKNLCSSCGVCWSSDPLNFFEDNDDKANVKNPISNEQTFKVSQSVCPAAAIFSNF